jgi:glycosidase
MSPVRRAIYAVLASALLVLGLTPASQAAPGIATGVAATADSGSVVRHWSKDAVIYEVNVRQYTPEGTFDAFKEHLPRLKRLGVEILWFMPVFPISQQNRLGTLGSYYSVSDYTSINPEFGTLEDFKALVRKAHALGFKVLMDFVPNHTGWDHPWLQEHPDWYLRDDNGNPVSPPGTNWSDVIQLDWENQSMRAALIDAMTFWVREADIDGYRMDYVAGIPEDFWPQVHDALSQLPKRVFLLAENEDKTHLLEREFHANYGWTMFGTMVQIAQGTKHAADLRAYLDWVQDTYPERAYPMLFTSNHDENSWNGTTRELFGGAERTMAVLTFVSPGMPLIYSGQEAGLDKRLLFFDKDEIPWTDLSMQSFYEKLVDLKKQNPTLWNGQDGGSIRFLPTSDDDTLAFVREKVGGRDVVVVVNLSAGQASTTVQVDSFAGNYHDYFADDPRHLDKVEKFDFAPWEYKVLVE